MMELSIYHFLLPPGVSVHPSPYWLRSPSVAPLLHCCLALVGRMRSVSMRINSLNRVSCYQALIGHMHGQISTWKEYQDIQCP